MFSSEVIKAYFASAIRYSEVDMRKAYKAAWHGMLAVGSTYLVSQGATMDRYALSAMELMTVSNSMASITTMVCIPSIIILRGASYDYIEKHLDEVEEERLIPAYRELVVSIGMELGYTMIDEEDECDLVDHKYIEIVTSTKNWESYTFCERDCE